MLQQGLSFLPISPFLLPPGPPLWKGSTLHALSCYNCPQFHMPCLPSNIYHTVFVTRASIGTHCKSRDGKSPIGSLGLEALFSPCHSWNLVMWCHFACMQGIHFCAFCFVFLAILSLLSYMNTCTQEQWKRNDTSGPTPSFLIQKQPLQTASVVFLKVSV